MLIGAFGPSYSKLISVRFFIIIVVRIEIGILKVHSLNYCFGLVVLISLEPKTAIFS